MKFQYTWSLDFNFYGTELNPALQISDQISKVQIRFIEISHIAYTLEGCS